MVLLSKAFIENWRDFKEITYLNVSIKVSTVKYYKLMIPRWQNIL